MSITHSVTCDKQKKTKKKKQNRRLSAYKSPHINTLMMIINHYTDVSHSHSHGGNIKYDDNWKINKCLPRDLKIYIFIHTLVVHSYKYVPPVLSWHNITTPPMLLELLIFTVVVLFALYIMMKLLSRCYQCVSVCVCAFMIMYGYVPISALLK